MNEASNSVRDANTALAKQYFKIVSQYSKSWDTYLRMEQVIATSDVDISGYFRANGSLLGLGIPGVGEKTRTILEGVLATGTEAMKDVVATVKAEALQSQSIGLMPGSIADDGRKSLSSNQWDDAVKRRESD